MKKKLPILLTALAITATSHAAVLSSWTYEVTTPADVTDNTTAPTTASEAGLVTTGVSSAFHTSALTDWTTPTGNGSANSLSTNNWTVGDYYQFTTSTTGYAGVTITFDQVSSSTGPRDFTIYYSTDGTSFTSTGNSYTVFQNSAVGTNAFSFGTWSSSTANSAYSYSFNLSSITALDNQSTIYLRLQLSGTANPAGGTFAAAGTNRVDNVSISATAVPEPGISLISTIGFIGLLRRRR